MGSYKCLQKVPQGLIVHRTPTGSSKMSVGQSNRIFTKCLETPDVCHKPCRGFLQGFINVCRRSHRVSQFTGLHQGLPKCLLGDPTRFSQNAWKTPDVCRKPCRRLLQSFVDLWWDSSEPTQFFIDLWLDSCEPTGIPKKLCNKQQVLKLCFTLISMPLLGNFQPLTFLKMSFL